MLCSPLQDFVAGESASENLARCKYVSQKGRKVAAEMLQQSWKEMALIGARVCNDKDRCMQNLCTRHLADIPYRPELDEARARE